MTQVQSWPSTQSPVSGGPVLRTYAGKPEEAAAAFQSDAQRMATAGWYPVAQFYTPGSWGAAAFLVALLLAIILIGILIFIYLLVVKPAGTLTVTYEHRGTTYSAPPPMSTGPDWEPAPVTTTVRTWVPFIVIGIVVVGGYLLFLAPR